MDRSALARGRLISRPLSGPGYASALNEIKCTGVAGEGLEIDDLVGLGELQCSIAIVFYVIKSRIRCDCVQPHQVPGGVTDTHGVVELLGNLKRLVESPCGVHEPGGHHVPDRSVADDS